MLCPECQKLELKSKVYPGLGMETLMYCAPFYDEQGAYHHHDLNITTSKFTCSNSHTWEQRIGHGCWCGWPDSGPYVEGGDG